MIENPIVFMEFRRAKTKLGRVKIQLYANLLPKTAENFRQLCTGQFLQNQKPTGFKGTCIHEISENCIVGGDYKNYNGTGGMSVYEDPFSEISSSQIHAQNYFGTISMVENEKGKYSSIFCINCSEEKGKMKNIFGKVTDELSLKVLKSIVTTPVNQQQKPKVPVIVYQCGQM